MQILLLDNAIDSFEWSLKHLRTFLEIDSRFENPNKSTTSLKQAIISLNTSLELFFKAKISDINPFLIYEHVSTDDVPNTIVEYYTKMQSNEITEPLYNYMIANSDIHTIDYTKCIELYCKIYSTPQGHQDDFIALNGIRNKLIHLGINTQEEYYILAGRIANTLQFVEYKILRTLKYDKKHISDICCDMLNIQFTLTSLEDDIWFKVNQTKIKIICDKIEKVFKSTEISSYLLSKNISADYGSTLDMPFSYGLFTLTEDSTEHEIVAIYSTPNKNSIIISDSEKNDGPVFAIITLSNKSELPTKFYISKEQYGSTIPDFCEQSHFWTQKPYKDSFSYVPFGEPKLIDMIKNIIDYMSIINFVPYDEPYN